MCVVYHFTAKWVRRDTKTGRDERRYFLRKKVMPQPKIYVYWIASVFSPHIDYTCKFYGKSTGVCIIETPLLM